MMKIWNIHASVFASAESMKAEIERIDDEHGTLFVDAETLTGREKLRSAAMKIARHKTAIDATGKELVTEWKEKAKRVDALRKIARDSLDEIRDRVRKPADEYDARVARVAAAKAEAEARNMQEAEAKRLVLIEERERKLEAAEAAIRAQAEQAEQVAREARRDIEQSDREDRIREQATEQARRDAERAAESARQHMLAEEAKRKRAEEAKSHRDNVHTSILDDLAALGGAQRGVEER